MTFGRRTAAVVATTAVIKENNACGLGRIDVREQPRQQAAPGMTDDHVRAGNSRGRQQQAQFPDMRARCPVATRRSCAPPEASAIVGADAGLPPNLRLYPAPRRARIRRAGVEYDRRQAGAAALVDPTD
jgi:hypothetical protein